MLIDGGCNITCSAMSCFDRLTPRILKAGKLGKHFATVYRNSILVEIAVRIQEGSISSPMVRHLKFEQKELGFEKGYRLW